MVSMHPMSSCISFKSKQLVSSVVLSDQITDVGRVRKNTAIHCQFRLVYSKLGITAEVRFNRAKQMKRRRQRRPALYG